MEPTAPKQITELSRQDALTLHNVLVNIGDGLSPLNAMLAADNINTLYPTANSLNKGQLAAQRKQALVDLPNVIDAARARLEIGEPIEARGEELVKLDLKPMNITQEEIKTAKITPGFLAVLRRMLPTS